MAQTPRFAIGAPQQPQQRKPLLDAEFDSLVQQVIRRLRTSTTRFEERIGGLAELGLLRQETNLLTPCAFVLPGDEDVTEDKTQSGAVTSALTMRVNFTVVVWLDANADDRNQETTHQLEAIRRELINSLLIWQPSSRHEPCRYRGMSIGGQDAGRSVYLYNFSVTESIAFNVCYPVVGGVTPVVDIAKSLDRWFIAPDGVDTDTCKPAHSKPIGLHIAPASCETDADPCHERATVSIELREPYDDPPDDCET